METILVLKENHPDKATDPRAVIQQAVMNWLTKELSK